MAITNSINTKSNVKQKTDADLLSNLGQPVIARQNYVSTAGQTAVPASGSLPFSVDQNNKENFELFIDGRLLTEGASADYTFSEIDGNNSSSKIALNAVLPAGLNIVAIKRGIKKESDQGVDARVTAIQDMSGAAFQSFVDESQLITGSASPTASQFWSSISGRAPVVDFAKDLKANMGIERIQLQQVYPLEKEIGPNGERVHFCPNDPRGQARFVGAWTNTVDSNGSYIRTTNAGDFVEFTFYGTGVNLLTYFSNDANDWRASIDGGAEGGDLHNQTFSSILTGRNYTPNQPLPLFNNLTLGYHTVKVRLASGFLFVFGFEVVNESSLVKVSSGNAYIQGKKLASSGSNFAYNTGVTGSRGGRTVVYVKSDGTIGSSFQPVNASSGFLTGVDHSNEEIIRKYQAREFGANRSDDLSSLPSVASSNRAFTMEDGTTTLVGTNVYIHTNEALGLNGSTGIAQITFVGTGLDVIKFDGSSATGKVTPGVISVDGTVVGSFSANATLNRTRITICSGLPYGTHTVRFTNGNGLTFDEKFDSFLVYGPKKPAIPAGAVEIADYNVMANFAANSTAGPERSATGVLRKFSTRELTYIGTGWSFDVFTNARGGGFATLNATVGNALSYTFFGTGFDFRFGNTSAGATQLTVAVDGVTNLSGAGYSTGFYGAGITSFTASTGIIACSTTGDNDMGAYVTGLPLGLHTVTITKTSGAFNTNVTSLDIITPIHSSVSKSNEFQSTLPVGSCAISDNRMTSAIAFPAKNRFRGTVFGVTGGPSTTSTAYIPIPDMIMPVYSQGSWFRINAAGTFVPTTGGGPENLAIYIDGLRYGNDMQTGVGSGVGGSVFIGYSNHALVYLPKGVHLIEWKWKTGGNTLSGRDVSRTMTVEEI
jgi:hypothetical protein